MLRRTLRRLGGGGHHSIEDEMYPHGKPKRTFPFYTPPKHIGTAPQPGGFYLTKYAWGQPLQYPFEITWYRLSFGLGLFFITLDILGFNSAPAYTNAEPGKPHHFFFGNNGGQPHHFWIYQDGFYLPNESGAFRWVP
jgi:hypothetical protein